MAAQLIFETGGVKNGAGADHALGGEAGDTLCGVGQYIHGIRDDHENTGEAGGGEVRQNAFEDRDIFIDEIEPRLARLLICSRGDNDEGAVGSIPVVARVDVHRGGVGQAVAEIHGLALSLFVVGVDEDKLGEKASLHQAEGNGRADEAAADNGGFALIDHGESLLFSN